MGIGHIAVGLGLKRADRQVNVGLLIFAALLCDFLLGWFALAGWENYDVPADYASKHYLLFTFPWSHGLIPVLGWAAAFGLLVGACLRSRRAGIIASIAVFSHYILDGIVHVKALPVTPNGSFGFGLGLWRYLPVELALEVAMVVAGVVIYLRSVPAKPRSRALGIVVYTSGVAILTVGGQATATVVPSRSALIVSWLLMPLTFALMASWLDRSRPASTR